jgi:hypothetical protein
MTELMLREAPESRGNNFQVFDEAGQIVGYIVLLTALARTHDTPWMWLIASTFHDGCEQTHGFGATRDDAMEAFTRCWLQTSSAR